MNKFKYVLITAARNEEANITRTIQSVINQTVLPEKWIIISDSSNDGTDDIVRKYVASYQFIDFISIKNQGERNFISKVNAINLGYGQLNNVSFDFIGILDADISFESNYYEYILNQFQNNPKLGIGGGLIFDVFANKCIPWITRLDSSVGGPIQMFRRKFYEDVGGLIGQEKGGEDAIAEFMCRMHGWQVQTFPSVKAYHYRRVGTAEGQSIWRARFMQGERDYLIGYHPLF